MKMGLDSLSKTCPVCGNDSTLLAYGLIAPWILILNNRKPGSQTRLMRCTICETTFFGHRYSESEMSSLYGEYRQSSYFQIRNSWEPWFRKSDNAAFDDSNQQFLERKAFLSDSFIKAGLGTRVFDGCIDFGGDLGQFIPDGVEGNKVVIDYSNKAFPGDGILRFRDLAEVSFKVDLVLNCHVLEHLPEIGEVLRDIRQHIRSGGYVYIEIPQDSFRTSAFHKTILYRKWLHLISRSRILFMALDFISGVSRQFFGRIPWFGIIKQSEHLNYFRSKSLQYLLESAGFVVVKISPPTRGSKQGKLRFGRMSAIGIVE
jgi:SAM-dependent methyltransferase